MTGTAPEGFDPTESEPDLDSDEASSSSEDIMVPIVWRKLNDIDYAHYILELNAWVEEDLRPVFDVPATVVPPYWHRHELLIELLTGLWCHWLQAHDEQQNLSAKFLFHRDVEEWKGRMREAVAMLGCRIDSDRPSRPVLWPGEKPTADTHPPIRLDSREEDFHACVLAEENRREILAEEALDKTLARQSSPLFFAEDPDDE